MRDHVEYRKPTKCESLVRPVVSFVMGVAFGVGLTCLAVRLDGLPDWRLYGLYVCPVVLVALNWHAIRSELKRRERVRRGEVEIIDFGTFRMVRPTGGEKRLKEAMIVH